MSSSKSGIELTSVVFLIFLILKLTKNIDWSWWWIFSPLWIPIVLSILFFIITILFSLLYTGYTGKSVEDFLKKNQKSKTF